MDTERKRILTWFWADTQTKLDELAGGKEDSKLARETIERVQVYLDFSYPGQKMDVKEYLADEGYSLEDVESWLSQAEKEAPILAAPSTGSDPLAAQSERKIARWFLRDTLQLFRNALREDVSAITTENRLRLYLAVFPAQAPLEKLVQREGFSQQDIDLFYQKFRRECLLWYNGEPCPPLLAKGELRVYKVQDATVVAIRSEKPGKILSPKGVEFSETRSVNWTYHLSLVRCQNFEPFLHKGRNQLEKALGPAHLWVRGKKRKRWALYILDTGCIAVFQIVSQKVTKVRVYDLLPPEPSLRTVFSCGMPC